METAQILIEEIIIFFTFFTCLYLIHKNRSYKDELIIIKSNIEEKDREIINTTSCIQRMNLDLEIISSKIDNHLSNPKCCKDLTNDTNSNELPYDELSQLRKLFPEKLDGHSSVNFTIEFYSEKRDYSNIDILTSLQSKLESDFIYIPLNILYNMVKNHDKTNKIKAFLRLKYVKEKKRFYDRYRLKK